MPDSTPQDEEQFDLDDVSNSKNDYDPLHSDHGSNSDANSTAQEEDSCTCIHVNDPDTVPLSKTDANDIHYFFNKSGDKVICNICRQVLLRSWLFSALN